MAKAKNKPKLWRRLAKKKDGVRNGRLIRENTAGFSMRVGATPFITALLNRLPDVTEVLKRYEKKVKTNETK